MCTYIYLRVLLITMFSIVGTMFLYYFIYVYFILIVLSVLVKDYSHRAKTQLE